MYILVSIYQLAWTAYITVLYNNLSHKDQIDHAYPWGKNKTKPQHIWLSADFNGSQVIFREQPGWAKRSSGPRQPWVCKLGTENRKTLEVCWLELELVRFFFKNVIPWHSWASNMLQNTPKIYHPRKYVCVRFHHTPFASRNPDGIWKV